MKNNEHSFVYSVSALNHAAAMLITEHFGGVCVSGEISNLSRPSSGHLYFSLKDANAHIRCALFRFQHQQVDFPLENGQHVIVRAQVGVYEPRGDFQLIVSAVQLAGIGKLQLAFEQLKKELEKQGLFDERHKKSLPAFPKKIGVITSSTTAALQDILKVLRKRAPQIPIMIYPTMVQGELAAAQIAHAIVTANKHNECDVLILARGGGSLEDLWSFNEKKVAEAIFDSAIPIITGIGHQTDFTIADFVADVRAPTPSAAAEIISPDQIELLAQLAHYYQRLLHRLDAQLKLHHTHLTHLQKRLKNPADQLQQQSQQLDQLETQLIRVMHVYLDKKRGKIAHCAHALNTLSPLNILQRGFSITRHKKNNHIIISRHDVHAGDCVITRVTDGEFEAVIQGIV